MLAVLDSTVLIDFLRGRPAVQRVAELRQRADTLATTSINVEEIVRGIRPGEEPTIRELVDALVILNIDGHVAWTAGTWRRVYAAGGSTLWQADCLVAAAAYHADARLCTGNPKDFPMREVAVEHWPVGQ